MKDNSSRRFRKSLKAEEDRMVMAHRTKVVRYCCNATYLAVAAVELKLRDLRCLLAES